jgi:hypothetical protein
MQESYAEESVAYFFKQDAGARTEMRPDALGAIYRDYPESWNREALFSMRPVPTLAPPS